MSDPVEIVLYTFLFLSVAGALAVLILRIKRRIGCTVQVTARRRRVVAWFQGDFWEYSYKGKTYQTQRINSKQFLEDEITVFIDPTQPQRIYIPSDVYFWILFVFPTAFVLVLMKMVGHL